MFMQFILEGVSLSQNKWDSAHWGKRYQIRNEWFEMIKLKYGTSGMTHKCDVRVVRVSKRLIDPCNVMSALKPVIDGFVEYGWLRGDRCRDIVITTDQRKCLKDEEPYLEITINKL